MRNSRLISHVISARGYASRSDATAGSVWTMSPSELGLMIKIDLGFRVQGQGSRFRQT